MSKQALIAKLHIGKSQLGLDDFTYRSMLESLTGKTSSKQLSIAEAERVVHHLQSCGAKLTIHAPNKPKRKKVLDPQLRKMWAIWLQMADKGYVRERNEKALVSWLKRQGFNVDRLEWLNSAEKSKAIDSLKAWQQRENQREKALAWNG